MASVSPVDPKDQADPDAQPCHLRRGTSEGLGLRGDDGSSWSLFAFGDAIAHGWGRRPFGSAGRARRDGFLLSTLRSIALCGPPLLGSR
jgi:hypothetical protein